MSEIPPTAGRTVFLLQNLINSTYRLERKVAKRKFSPFLNNSDITKVPEIAVINY